MPGGMFLPGGMQGMMQLPPGMMEPDFGPFSQVLTVAGSVLYMAKVNSGTPGLSQLPSSSKLLTSSSLLTVCLLQPGMGRGPPFPRPPFPGPMSQEAAIDESSRRPGSLNGQIFHKTRLCVKCVSQLPVHQSTPTIPFPLTRSTPPLQVERGLLPLW